MTRPHFPVLLGLVVLAPGIPAAWGQTILDTAHNGSANNGFVVDTQGASYIVQSGATFDNNHFSGLVSDNGVNLNVENGDFSGNGYSGLETLNVSAVVNGGTFTGNTGEGLAVIDASNVTVNGGDYTGNTFAGVLLNGGNLSAATLDVTGGTFTGNQYGVSIQNGIANIRGGTFDNVGYDIFGSGSVTTLYGQWIGGPMTISSSTTGTVPITGSFTGTLANGGGQQIFSYEIYKGGEIVLANSAPAVPESSSLVLLTLPLASWGCFAASRRKTCATS